MLLYSVTAPVSASVEDFLLDEDFDILNLAPALDASLDLEKEPLPGDEALWDESVTTGTKFI